MTLCLVDRTFGSLQFLIQSNFWPVWLKSWTKTPFSLYVWYCSIFRSIKSAVQIDLSRFPNQRHTMTVTAGKISSHNKVKIDVLASNFVHNTTINHNSAIDIDQYLLCCATRGISIPSLTKVPLPVFSVQNDRSIRGWFVVCGGFLYCNMISSINKASLTKIYFVTWLIVVFGENLWFSTVPWSFLSSIFFGWTVLKVWLMHDTAFSIF